jgi:aspartyl-tRNA synthetase
VSLPDETIHLLFSANRWETVEKLLSELRSGTDVVCDRYVYSGIAYSAAKGLDLEWCRAPDKGLPEPDLVLYMKVSAEVARQRGGYGEERYEKEAFQRTVGEQFMKMGCSEKNWRVINADRDPGTISAEVTEIVGSLDKTVLECMPTKLWTEGYVPERLTSSATIPLQSISALKLLPGQKIRTRGRLQHVRKQGGKLAFGLLRDRMDSVQIVAVGADLANQLSSLPKESVVDISGTVSVPPTPIKEASESGIEIAIDHLVVASRSEDILPVQLDDLENRGSSTVALETRLNYRVVDLRTRSNQAIFTIQGAIEKYFSEFFMARHFTRIHSPKLVPAASEGGANVFAVSYFGKSAYLAQSPQLYKQMALMGDFPGVFEVGPVFRAENSMTHRHMTEFVGLDFEMRIGENWMEIVDTVDALFNFIFTKVFIEQKRELEIISERFDNPIQWSYPCLKLEFSEAIELLKSHGPAIVMEDIKRLQTDLSVVSEEVSKSLTRRLEELSAHLESITTHPLTADLGTSDEKLLGRIVKKIHKTDFYMILRYPRDTRPFYTMPCSEDPSLTNSYDVFLRGEEIMSGAQRIHDAQILTENAKKIDIESLKPYIDSFRYGAYPHGGGGVGLERVVMLLCGLPNIRLASLFPRDPNRLSP